MKEFKMSWNLMKLILESDVELGKWSLLGKTMSSVAHFINNPILNIDSLFFLPLSSNEFTASHSNYIDQMGKNANKITDIQIKRSFMSNRTGKRNKLIQNKFRPIQNLCAISFRLNSHILFAISYLFRLLFISHTTIFIQRYDQN